MKKIITLCTILATQINWAQSFKNDTAIQKILTEKINKVHIPGMAAAIIYKDSIYYNVAGTISNESKEPISDKTLFHIASNTKAFTSFLAFQAIEKNKLKLETKFFDLYPELKSDKNKAYHAITLKDLLGHQAQVQPFTAGNEINQIKITKESVSDKRKEFATEVLNLPKVEKRTYSNAGYVLASMMIEKVENKPFEDVLATYLKTNDWDYSYGFPNKKDTKNAWGHWVEEDKLVALAPNHFYQLPNYMLAAGDLSMNIKDYSQWLYQHIKNLQNKEENNPYQIMHYQQEGMSYGWGNAVQNGQKLSYHDGSAGTYYTHAILLPEKEIGITIFTNSADEKHVKAVYELQQELLAHLKTKLDGNNR